MTNVWEEPERDDERMGGTRKGGNDNEPLLLPIEKNQRRDIERHF